MKNILSSAIGRLRLVTLLEGLSLIVLILIAMPLKYFYQQPQYVRFVGSLHGALFILFILAVIATQDIGKWNIKHWAIFLICSFIPFGTFYIDKKYFKNLS